MRALTYERDTKRVFIESAMDKYYVYNKNLKLSPPTVIDALQDKWSYWRTHLKMPGISCTRGEATDIQATRLSRESTTAADNILHYFTCSHKI